MPEQAELFDPTFSETHSMLSQLIEQSRLYEYTKDFRELLDFVVQLPSMAPFNAMLLHIQKPGLRFAATAQSWRERLGRTIRDGARPLVVLVPFGPVGFVYDMADTEGPDLPESVAQAFRAVGSVDEADLNEFRLRLEQDGITVQDITAGDGNAGHVKRALEPTAKKTTKGGAKSSKICYEIALNAAHIPAVRFATLVHELAHVFLGHLGPDQQRRIPDRQSLLSAEQEIEAESCSYLICARNGIQSRADAYLSGYVARETRVEGIDIYAIMKAAGQVEVLLGIACRDAFSNKPSRL